jgi:hypothetical protein
VTRYKFPIGRKSKIVFSPSQIAGDVFIKQVFPVTFSTSETFEQGKKVVGEGSNELLCCWANEKLFVHSGKL